MIGTITFADRGTSRTIALHEDGHWTITTAIEGELFEKVGTMLREISESYGGPSHGFFGPAQLQEAKLIIGVFFPGSNPTVWLAPRERAARDDVAY